MDSSTSNSPTTSPPSGETASSEPNAIEKRRDELDALLDDYEQRLGLPAFSFAGESDATRLLNLTSNDLRGMSAVDIGEAAFTLERLSLHLQRALNREQARARWCEDSIRRLTAKTTTGISNYYHRDERLSVAIEGNETARKFDKIRMHALQRVTRIDFLAGKIEAMSKTLMSLQATKRGIRE